MQQELYLSLFRQALRIRLAEEKIITLYPSDKIQSPVHLSIGQEAVAVGVCSALPQNALLFSSYRGHAWFLAKGGSLSSFFAELYGKDTGCGRGKAGSMHLAEPDVGFMGSSAVVASTIPHAVGAALAAKVLGKQQISVAVFGDGATEEGVYHESLNFASLHSLPILFICENNDFAVHSRRKVRQCYSIAEHAKGYGIESQRIPQGMDFLEIHRVTQEIVAQMAAEPKPLLLEIDTYRYKEHVGPGEDLDAGYRSAEERRCWAVQDPLLNDLALVQELTPAIEAEIDDAVSFAESSPWPLPDQLLSDVY